MPTTATQEAKKAKTAEQYHLLYWPGIPGRGEFVRLALEDAGADYKDTPGGANEVVAYIMPDFTDPYGAPPPYAPPILSTGSTTLSQTSNILLYLGPRLGLTPEDEAGRLHVNQLTLTALDLVDETHNTHHPTAISLYYEDQKDEAKRYSKFFRDERIPKYLGYFDRVLKKNEEGKSEWLVGSSCTYADLVIFQVVDGLLYGFPKAVGRELEKHALLKALYGRVKGRPRIKAYLESERRQKYSMGIFRRYPELDE